jgi:hypothetical protein
MAAKAQIDFKRVTRKTSSGMKRYGCNKNVQKGTSINDQWYIPATLRT